MTTKQTHKVESYGAVVREVRLIRNVTMGGLARMIGVSAEHMSAIERDIRAAKASEHHAIDMAIGIAEHATFEITRDATARLVHSDLTYEVHELGELLDTIDMRSPYIAFAAAPYGEGE